MKIKQLSWELVEGHFGRSHMATVPVGDPYFIWQTDEGFKCAIPAPNRRHEIHGDLAKAREYCQRDFEERIKECIEAS